MREAVGPWGSRVLTVVLATALCCLLPPARLAAAEMVEIPPADAALYFDTNQTVVVMFYTPPCPACRAFEPVWREFGLRYPSNGPILIAKINADFYRLETMNIKALPAIYMYHAGGNGDESGPYEGEHELPQIQAWIEDRIRWHAEMAADRELEWELQAEQAQRAQEPNPNAEEPTGDVSESPAPSEETEDTSL